VSPRLRVKGLFRVLRHLRLLTASPDLRRRVSGLQREVLQPEAGVDANVRRCDLPSFQAALIIQSMGGEKDRHSSDPEESPSQTMSGRREKARRCHVDLADRDGRRSGFSSNEFACGHRRERSLFRPTPGRVSSLRNRERLRFVLLRRQRPATCAGGAVPLVSIVAATPGTVDFPTRAREEHTKGRERCTI
jgi:hypothetical protein